MSRILSEWLNNDLHLSQKIDATSLDERFRSGYLFGELLSKYNVANASVFSQLKSTDSWVSNYIKLEPVFRMLGIPYNAQIVKDLMEAKPGSAAKILYQLRITLPKIAREKRSGRSGGEGDGGEGRSGLSTMMSYPSTPVSGDPVKFGVVQKEHKFFVENLKSKTRRVDYELEAIAERFQRVQEEQEDIEEKKARMMIEKLKRLEEIRRAEKGKHRLEKSRLRQGRLPKTHVEMMKVVEEERRLEKAKKRIESFKMYREYIDDFEQRNRGDEKERGVQEMKEAREEKLLKIEKDQVQEVKNKERLSDEIMEQELKEKKILAEINEKQENRFKELKDEEFNLILVRESREERRLAAELNKIKKEKEIMIRNRLFREQQYKEQREKDFENAIKREINEIRMNKKQFERNLEMNKRQYEELINLKKEKKKKKLFLDCKRIVNEVISLSLKFCEYRELGDGNVPKKMYLEWIRLFIRGFPLDVNYEIKSEDDAVENEEFQKIEDEEDLSLSSLIDTNSVLYKGLHFMDKLEFDDYLNMRGIWDEGELNRDLKVDGKGDMRGELRVDVKDVKDLKDNNNKDSNSNGSNANLSNNNISNTNEALARIVKIILDSNHIKPENIQKPIFPKFPLKLVIIGKVLSGKNTLANKLKNSFGLKILNVQEILSLDDNLMVSIVANKIKECNLEIEEKRFGGWVLIDFPRTRNQAMLLDKELIGYEEPKQVRSGNLKRGKGQLITKKSYIANLNEVENAPIVNIGSFDGVFLLDVSNDVVFERANGRMMDNLTGKIYNLNDLETNQVELKEQLFSNNRLVPIEQDLIQIQVIDCSLNEKQVEDFVKIEIDRIELEKEKEKERKENELEEKEGVLNTSTATTQGNTATDNTSLNVTFANNTLPLTSTTSTTTTTAATTLSPTATSSVTLLNCLADQWATMENVFVNGVKFIFRSIRREKESILRYFFNVKRKYEEYLQRPDDKQFFINKFQNYFNSFEDDQRSDNEVKNEIFLKCLELQNNLWEISEKLKEEGEVERQMIINNRWLEDHLIFNINYYLGLFQLELDRHFNTKQIVLDYFKDLEGKALDEKNTDEFKLEFLQISQEDPKIKLEQSKSIKKKKEETNDLNYFTNFISNSFNECTSKLSIEFNLDQFSTLNQSEISKIIKTDESITRKRLERIKFHATESLKEIYAKSQETFNILEEWNNNKFNAEMNSIKEMINVIQEAIEIEIPLKNQLLLFGNSFHVNSNCELEICERAVNVEP
ncbi:hypothetical protein O9G_005789, partial [Rozella allomycis CSF55]